MRPGEEEIVELVNAAVDGVATAEQQAELERLLATAPDVRQMYEATKDIARRLEAMNVEAPADLRSWFVRRSVVALPRRAEAHRYTFAAAWAAAAALVLVFLIIGRQQMTDTGATMAPPAWPVIERIGAPEATLLVRRQGEMVSLEVIAPRPESVEIAWDASQAAFVGVFDDKDASLRKASVQFTLRDPSKRAGVVVRARHGASSVVVTLSVENREVLRSVVALK